MFDWYFASGDLGFLWEEQIHAFSWLPDVFLENRGFGFNTLLSLWLNYPFRLVVKLLATVGLSWFVIEKLLWISVFAIAIYSSYKLTKSAIGSLVYAANTYFLLLFAGGQLGVALAYGFSPFVLYRFITFQKGVLKEQILNGLYFAVLIAFDLRLAYLMLGAIVLWGIRSLVPFIVAFLVHLYWVLPTVFASSGTASLGAQFTNSGMLKFLSFADFPHTLTLLHPNWPENLFGKVYFMQAEFLIIPFVAFASLLFATKRIRFFAILALIGAFFAKGSQDPFGALFVWMFENVPGFVMFRDPTKFYIFVAIGYSALIPFVFSRITNYRLRITTVIIFIVFWLFTIRALPMGQVAGNFRPSRVPQEYVELKNILLADLEPSRALWIPHRENFAFSTEVHPEFSADDLFHNASSAAILDLIRESVFIDRLSEAGVKYVIVPMDVEQRMFLKDYQFDPNARKELILALEKTSLTRNTAFDDLAVFENKTSVMHAETPDIVHKQQRLAITGTALSGMALVFFLCILLF